nr:hypothetical protein [Tanacetum cinerariifolium]
HPILAAPVPTQAGQQVALEALAAHATWVKGSKEIVGLMLMTMDSEMQRNLENLGAYEMLQKLKTLFAQQAEQELLQTMREFHSCKQEEGQSVSSYVLKMKIYIDNLKHLGHPMTTGLGVGLILISLRKEFDGFVHIYNMHSMGKTINELHAMLKLHEQTLPKNNAPALHAIQAGKGKNKLAYAPKPKIPPPPKREDPAKDLVCHQCGDTCHWKTNYPQYLAKLLKNKKLSQGASDSGIFTIKLYTFPNKSWVYDTGCATHICNTTHGLKGSRKLKPGALSLYVDNVYFSVVSLDGIFKIDLSDSYTNVSSMYALSNKRAKSNLDSDLLWHCRLRHISKKRIEKLKHDGLLNSSDLRAFEKCVPCMSSKMARKPYSHQVERAKDLLGLIHTDVCGPFKIMSRQGASYFVTFTDDFSRYGFVYLLKHKHEVFKTFKVFQKEVENQLDRMCLYIDVEEHELGDLGELANYKAALLDPGSDKWLNAINVKMQFMKDNEVWDLVELPPNGKTVGSKWLFKKKTDMDGAVHTYKARLVAKGYTQTPRIDYEETFSLVVDIRAIRILIAKATFYDYEIWQMDVKTAFLNGYLFEEVYMKQPKGDIKRELKVSCYTDAGYLTDVDDLKSQTGYVFVLNGGGVDWKSTKQSIFATSFIETEYIASFDASKEAVWVNKFISWLGVVPKIKDLIRITKGARHFCAKVHYLREVIEY